MTIASSEFFYDLSTWTQLDLIGAEAQNFFNNFATQDFKALPAGQTRESFVCDIKGRILAHMQVLVTDEGLSLIMVPGAAPALVKHLTKYLLGADVQFVEHSDAGLLLVQGSQTISTLCSVLGIAAGPEQDQFITTSWEENAFRLLPTKIVSAPAMLVSGSREGMTSLASALTKNSAASGSNTQFDWERIAAGFPIVGQDIGEANLAQEAARTQQTISFRKGCYLGQEPIARLDAMGHTNKELRSIRIESTDIAVGDTILFDNQPVGQLTSVAINPASGQSVALGLVRTKANAPDTQVVIENTTGQHSGVVF